MCLAAPGRIVRIEGTRAVVDFRGVRRNVQLDLLPAAAAGDVVLVHAGFAIQRLDPDVAADTIAALEEAEARLRAEAERGGPR
ncbi:MAG: HypC/HybG/HupF family hydrogenase formation chaperone [Planctomycetota bacterium]